MANIESVHITDSEALALSNAGHNIVADLAGNNEITLDELRSLSEEGRKSLRNEIDILNIKAETKNGLKTLIQEVESTSITTVVPVPIIPNASQSAPKWENNNKSESSAPLRNQGFTDLYIVARLLQLGVGPTIKNESAPKLESGIIKGSISIGKKMLHYGENGAVMAQEMFRARDVAIFNWMYGKVWVEKKHVDLMLRQLDDMKTTLSEGGMKQYIDTRKALLDASSLLTQIETEAAKTKPDQKVLEGLLKDYVKATDQYHRFELFTKLPGVPSTLTPEFRAMRTDVTNQSNALHTDVSTIEADLKRGERQYKLLEEALKKREITLSSQDGIIKKAEKNLAEKEKALNVAKDGMRPAEESVLRGLKDHLDDLEKELAEHSRKGGAPAGARASADIRSDLTNQKTAIRNQESIIASIENGKHPTLATEKWEFDTAKTDLESAKNRKIHLEEWKSKSEAKLAKFQEGNTKLETKHTEAQAKLAKLPDLVEMDRLLNIVEHSTFTDERIQAEKMLQKMRLDLDPTSRLYSSLNGADTATRRSAIEAEKTNRIQESLFIQWSELPNWMTEKQKEKILKARERIGEIYSQVDALHKEAKDVTTALEKDPKIATAEQFTKEVNTKVGVINDKITRLSPLIDDVIRDVSVAFPGLNRNQILQKLKIPALPNAGGETWAKKWNSAIETHAVNTKVGKGVFGALMLVATGHAAYDGFKKEWVAGTVKEVSDIGLWFVPGYDLMVAISGETLALVPGVQGKKLTTEERWIRAWFGVLGLVPVLGTGVKALATSAKVIGAVDKVADGVQVSNTVVNATNYTIDSARLAGHAATVGVVGSAAYNMAAPVFTSKKFKVALVDVSPIETKK